MAVTKRIMVTLPEHLLAELDVLVRETSGNRSQLVQEAMRAYLQAKQKRHLYETLKNGYMDMAEINLALARENLALENEALERTRVAGGVS
ncbi:MAG: ribbon-helix-helix domain-containing protein [Selenomonadales bacterium]|nr:ribbon-helix-helix domain-containing protein [Selenomonadales bacterium]